MGDIISYGAFFDGEALFPKVFMSCIQKPFLLRPLLIMWSSALIN